MTYTPISLELTTLTTTSDDDDDSDYNPDDEASDEGNSDEDEDENDTDDDDDSDTNDDTPQIPGMDNNVAPQIAGVDEEDGTEVVETPGVDDESEDVGNTGVDNESAETKNEFPQDDGQQSGEEQHDDPDTTRTYGGMRLRSQHRKEYDVFKDENDPIVLLQFSEDLEHLEEMYSLEAEYTFLTETLGWKEGLPETSYDTDSIKNLAAYMFLTEQMGWKQGLKVFKEKGEDAIRHRKRIAANSRHGGVQSQTLA
jgi:hypothetical protein